jgi:superfamily II DNA/RNA helicase
VKCSSDPAAKRDVLRRLLRADEDFKNAIIFCNRKRDVATLHRSLVKHGFNAVALHGDLEQPARMAALDQFRKGEAKLLIASDVAARGLDIPAVSHVFNFDVPYHPDDYVHRVGRTGRAGLTGTAITIVAPMDTKSMLAIEKLTNQTIPMMDVAGTPAPSSEDEEDLRAPRGRGGRSGGRSERGGRGRKPGGEREPRERQASAEREPRERQPAAEREPRERQPAAEREPREPRPAPIASIDEARTRRSAPRERQREQNEEADTSHLPAFLLRPVRVKA